MPLVATTNTPPRSPPFPFPRPEFWDIEFSESSRTFGALLETGSGIANAVFHFSYTLRFILVSGKSKTTNYTEEDGLAVSRVQIEMTRKVDAAACFFSPVFAKKRPSTSIEDQQPHPAPRS